jgi:hypothetical protein
MPQVLTNCVYSKRVNACGAVTTGMLAERAMRICSNRSLASDAARARLARVLVLRAPHPI